MQPLRGIWDSLRAPFLRHEQPYPQSRAPQMNMDGPDFSVDFGVDLSSFVRTGQTDGRYDGATAIGVIALYQLFLSTGTAPFAWQED